MTQTTICSACEGGGLKDAIPLQNCRACDGTGWIKEDTTVHLGAVALAEKWPGDYSYEADDDTHPPLELAFETARVVLEAALHIPNAETRPRHDCADSDDGNCDLNGSKQIKVKHELR